MSKSLDMTLTNSLTLAPPPEQKITGFSIIAKLDGLRVSTSYCISVCICERVRNWERNSTERRQISLVFFSLCHPLALHERRRVSLCAPVRAHTKCVRWRSELMSSTHCWQTHIVCVCTRARSNKPIGLSIAMLLRTNTFRSYSFYASDGEMIR